MKKEAKKSKRGPAPARLKIKGMGWEDAVAQALKAKPPAKPTNAKKKAKP